MNRNHHVIVTQEDIQKYLFLRRKTDYKQLESTVQDLTHILEERDISYRIHTRIKQAEAIYLKMQLKSCTFDEIHDRLGVRIVTTCIHDCYQILTSMKKTMKIVKVKDYIKNPKTTGYASLHLTVMSPSSMIEIQICTSDMSKKCSHGELKHKNYKTQKYRSLLIPRQKKEVPTSPQRPS